LCYIAIPVASRRENEAKQGGAKPAPTGRFVSVNLYIDCISIDRSIDRIPSSDEKRTKRQQQQRKKRERKLGVFIIFSFVSAKTEKNVVIKKAKILRNVVFVDSLLL